MKQLMREQGFTLLEILVALSIFVILAVVAVAGLRSIVSAEETTHTHAEKLADLQQAFMLLQRDTEQMVMRIIKDPYSQHDSVFATDKTSMKFTHAGWVNPGAVLQRGSLQLVAYVCKDKKLIRQTWPVLDPTPNTPSVERVLLKDVSACDFQYQADPTNSYGLPRLIEIHLTLKNMGELSWEFLGGAQL
jgi:general secretion pathway protein J